MIYVLEGADGTGKSTLANALASVTKGHVLHCTYREGWDIEAYHALIYNAARSLEKWQPVVIDRWALSELIYSRVFRNGPSYDTEHALKVMAAQNRGHVTWIWCHTDNVVERFQKLKAQRDEMFDRIDDVARAYEEWMAESTLPWLRYDLNKSSAMAFAKDIQR